MSEATTSILLRCTGYLHGERCTSITPVPREIWEGSEEQREDIRNHVRAAAVDKAREHFRSEPPADWPEALRFEVEDMPEALPADLSAGDDEDPAP